MLASRTTPEDPRDQKTYWFRMTALRRVVTFILKAAFWLFTTSQVEGVENLPRQAGVILAANHLTNFDVFILQFALPRPIFYMGKAELFQNPIMDWVFRQLGSFPVYRGERDEWAIRHAERVLAHGQVLGMFPEGTRSRGKGLRTAKTGVARLAQTCNCPIVPVALHGPQYMFRHFPRRTRIHITVGQALYPQPGETTLNLTDRMMFALAEMLPPEARGVYRYHPTGF
jgi:1-acyl-sn-glycerol-3-phosphate acyltransferase